MRYFAVLKYESVPENERPAPDFPLDYPKEVIKLGRSMETPTIDHVLMTEAEFRAYQIESEFLLRAYNEQNEIKKQALENIDDYMKQVDVFAWGLVQDFRNENILLNISGLGLTGHVRKTLAQVFNALQTGSLKDAILELALIDLADLDDTVLTASRLLIFRNKIEVFLGVPKATNWNDPKTW